ncbi:MAG: hypothetical protein ACODAJ_06230 [Planctomycetota bacterium]
MRTLAFALLCFAVCDPLSAGAPPTDNPVATYYAGDEGYPAWTDRVRWDTVIDMAAYAKGETSFEKFENARDELAAKGGGVLYYPAGVYDFSDGPFDGPDGRGLMLKPGVVIRGEAPAGRPKATSGKLELPTRFVFGFTRRQKAIETGRRASVWLDGAVFSIHRDRRRPVRLQLRFPVTDGKLQAEAAKSYAPLYGVREHPVAVKVSQDGDAIRLHVAITATAKSSKKKGADEVQREGQIKVEAKREGDAIVGSYKGTFDGQEVEGRARGTFFTVEAFTPRDWNLIGLCPLEGKRISDVDDVGICWVHLVGATVYFGPDVAWGQTWATAGSWKSRYVKEAWADRVPDGTHPWDPLAGGGKTHVADGSGRLVFGCVLEHAVGVNNGVKMGRPDKPDGFGDDGYYMAKFTPRIAAYGSRVLVANCLIPKSTGRNFKYRQLTRYTYPGGKGNSMAFGDESVRPVLFDYNKAASIDINKTLLGLTRGNREPEQAAGKGYFAEGIVVRDNWLYNHGHKGVNASGTWLTVRDNHNERAYLREANDPYYIGAWELTLDGYLQSSPGGNGAISDNLSRAFDLAGWNLWCHGNTFNNTGSDPGIDGEGILCQAHGGTHLYSWGVTHNTHRRGDGERGYIGAWNVRMHGGLIAWNTTPGWVGAVMFPEPPADLAFVANEAEKGIRTKGTDNALTAAPGGRPTPPKGVEAEAYQGDAVRVAWQDASSNEIGFRVDRKIGDGAWRPIAYRPPRREGSPLNPQAWVDFLAPPGQPLRYRVVAVNTRDGDSGASARTPPVILPSAARGRRSSSSRRSATNGHESGREPGAE